MILVKKSLCCNYFHVIGIYTVIGTGSISSRLIKPRLVVGIVIEQLKYDQLEKFRDKLGDNGIKKLHQ